MTTQNYRFRLQGFTLVELSIVLVIVALLLGGLIPTITSQIEQSHRNETRKQLDEIQQALIGFAIINGRLPCPANRAIATGAVGAGVEATTGIGNAMTCSPSIVTGGTAWGVLPWATLGVRETDAWGRRFTYQVTSAYADGADGTGSGACLTTVGISFQICSNGSLNIGSTSALTDTSIATNVPAIIVSHGLNGLGAYIPTGQVLPGATGEELDNTDTNNHFVSHDPTPNFDDQVVWLSSNILTSRMVAAGKLP
jgi:prepilin-type N-terminal cleavage/methylation domain-containing protein